MYAYNNTYYYNNVEAGLGGIMLSTGTKFSSCSVLLLVSTILLGTGRKNKFSLIIRFVV